VEDLLEYLVRALVDRPDEVSVEGFDEEDGTVVRRKSPAPPDALDAA